MDATAWAEELRRSGTALLRVRGTSMRPALRDGDVVAVGAEPPRPGDIAVVMAGGRILCHRCVTRSPGRLTLRGDGQRRAGRFAVPAEARVLGRVRAVVRGRRFRRPAPRWAARAAAALLVPLRQVLR
jgi:phage repressor protein C with HTH and peptisase S24 domain